MALTDPAAFKQAAEVGRELDHALAAGDSLEALVALYDRLSGHYNEAKGFVRHALAAATSARPQLMLNGVLLWSAMTKPLLQAVKCAGIRRVPERTSCIRVH